MSKSLIKRAVEKLKRKGIEINVSVKIGNNNAIEQKIKKPIYFEKE